MKGWNSFEYYDVCIIIVFRLSHKLLQNIKRLKRNLTKLIYNRKEEKQNLKSFYLRFFMEKIMKFEM